MKTLAPSQNINFEISPVNNTSINDYNTLRTMNDNNMNSIDKKIKSRYSSALDYLNTVSNKKISIPTTSLKNDKFIKLKNELLSSFIDKSRLSRFNIYSENNSFRNNILNESTSRNTNYDVFKEKIKNILSNPKESEEKKPKINKSLVITKLYNNNSLNKKTKDTIDEIFNIFKEQKIEKKKKNNENEDESSPSYKFKKLKEMKKHDKIYSNNILKGEIISNKILNNKYIKKKNPHIDLYDKKNSLEKTKKSPQYQRLIHMSKVLNYELNKNNDLEYSENNNKFMKDLFPITHERKIRSKLIDLNHFEIFPDFTKRHKKDELLEAYAENNLKIINDIKGDLTNKTDNNHLKNNDNNDKKCEKNEKSKINIKEEINIDDLLD